MSKEPRAARPILLITALQEELQEILTQCPPEWQESWNGFPIFQVRISGRSVVAIRCGVGKVLATMVTQYAIDRFAPCAVLNVGLCGALAPRLEVGDIVLSRDCIQHDFDARTLGFALGQIPYTDFRIIEADTQLLEAALQYAPDDYRVIAGRILTGDQFVSHADVESSELRTDLKGDAVEMEGAAVGLVAAIHRLPFLLIRTVSDRADHSAPVDFDTFLPMASHRAFLLLQYLLSSYAG